MSKSAAATAFTGSWMPERIMLRHSPVPRGRLRQSFSFTRVRILDAQCLFVSQEVPPKFPYKTKKPRKEQPVILTDFFAPFMATFHFMRCAFYRHTGSCRIRSCMKQSPLILLPNSILKSPDPFNNAFHNIACLEEFRRYESHADSCRRSCRDDRSCL